MYVVCRFPNAKRLEIFTENESIEVVLDIRLWALGIMLVLYPHFQIVKTIIGNDLDSLHYKTNFLYRSIVIVHPFKYHPHVGNRYYI